jgi:hypothetical protein
MLILVVLLIGLHPVADHFVEEAAAMCTVIALAGLIVVPLAGGRPSHPPEPRTQKRSPQRMVFRVCRVCLADGQGSFPLRR